MDALERAEKLVEQGRVEKAALLLLEERTNAEQNGQQERVRTIDELTPELRMYLGRGQRRTFDQVFARGAGPEASDIAASVRLSRPAIVIAGLYCGFWLVLAAALLNAPLLVMASIGLGLPILIALAAPRFGGALLVVGGVVAGGFGGLLGAGTSDRSAFGAVFAVILGAVVFGAPAVGPGLSFISTGNQRRQHDPTRAAFRQTL